MSCTDYPSASPRSQSEPWRHDLRLQCTQLRQLWSLQVAPEITIFVLARLLEILARHLCIARFGRASTNLFSNIEALTRAGDLEQSLALGLHGVRRLGNDARHGTRALSTLEDDLCVEWTAAALHSLGELEARTQSSNPRADWKEFCATLDERRGQAGSLCAQIRQPDSIEHGLALLDHVRGHPAAELALLEWLAIHGSANLLQTTASALKKSYPQILRFAQLRAVALSRLGNLDQAEREIRACIDVHDGAEVHGILGGILKRRWRKSGMSADLRDCARSYGHAWRESGGIDSYAGINLAAASLWLGQPRKAVRIARQVLEVYPADIAEKSIWAQLTKLEALVITRNWNDAQIILQRLTPDVRQSQAIGIFRQQFDLHRRFLGDEGDAFAASLVLA